MHGPAITVQDANPEEEVKEGIIEDTNDTNVALHSELQVKTEVNMFPIELSLRSHIIKIENEEQNEPPWKKIKPGEYVSYFNYDLKPKTWNLLVNKQIYMRFEKLLIEK